MRARGYLTRERCGCGNWSKMEGLDKNGQRRWRNRCEVCRQKAWEHRKDYCEHCGKKWEGGKKFDVDHIDGNPSNNDPSNLQTLCRKCHSTKSEEDKRAKKMLKMQGI